jgi:hypothetical protein
MKKFILRKILMLIYFLDRAKEQQLIRHNPCLFRTNSLYKVSNVKKVHKISLTKTVLIYVSIHRVAMTY